MSFKTFLSLLISVLATGLTGCDNNELPPAPEPPELSQDSDPDEQARSDDPLKTFAYDCVINGYVVIDYRNTANAAWIFLPGKTVQLPKAKSASGVKYDNGEISFFSKGSEAKLMTAEGEDHCIVNRKASIYEDAKLRGVDYRATGNEPGWVLEITGSSMNYLANYGTEKYQFEISGHEREPGSRNVVYSSNSGGNRISVKILGETCTDSMSGERFETAVELSFNDTSYKGCGRGLH